MAAAADRGNHTRHRPQAMRVHHLVRDRGRVRVRLRVRVRVRVRVSATVRVRARAMVRVRARFRVEGHAGHPLGGEDVLGRELRHHRGHGELGVAGQGSGEG